MAVVLVLLDLSLKLDMNKDDKPTSALQVSDLRCYNLQVHTHMHRAGMPPFDCSHLPLGLGRHVRRVNIHIMDGAMQQGCHTQRNTIDLVLEKHAPLRFECLHCGLACHRPAGQPRSGWAWLPEYHCRPVESGILAAPKPSHTAQLPAKPTNGNHRAGHIMHA